MTFAPIRYPWTLAVWGDDPTPRPYTFLDGAWPIWKDRLGAQMAAYSYSLTNTGGDLYRAVPMPSTGER